MDRINIKNLEIFANHGLLPAENALGQKFVISASLFTDIRHAGRSDDLTMSLDYSEVCRLISDYVTGNTFKLIETVIEGIAEMLLTAYPSLQKVWLELKKPWAPVAMHLETVSVEIERSRHIAYIALGSNMGDMDAHLRFAIDRLNSAHGCRVLAVSDFIRTAPYGGVEQDDFLNGCLKLDTLLPPHELLNLLHEIEHAAGRVRDIHWGPRTLDLDIIFYDDIVMSDNALRIPHIEAHKRDFVLSPLCELAPNMLHPVLCRTVSELLNELKNN